MKAFIILATCLAIGAAQQTSLIHKQVGREVRYQSNKPLNVECGIVTELGKNVKFEWQKEGKVLSSKINSRDGLLQIENPDLETEGVYMCLAKSDLGVASSGPISLKRSYVVVPKVETKKHTPVRGEPFQLECPQVDAYPKSEVLWFTQDNKSNIRKPVSGVHQTIGPNNFLYFANVTDNDISKDFKYVCVTIHPAASNTVVLAEHVIEGLKEDSGTGLKKAVPQYLSSDIVAKEGDFTFIYCIYGGAINPPDYFFDDKNVNGDDNPGKQRVTRHNRSKGRRLLIKETRQSDRGTYTCKIAETDGSTTAHSLRLAVVSVPSFTKKPDVKITAKQGENVVIPCQVSAVPKAGITWTYNTQLLSASKETTLNYSEKSGVVTNDVNIKGVQKSHSGYYGCTARNEFGEIFTETLLTVV